MLVWNGLGILTPVVGFLCILFFGVFLDMDSDNGMIYSLIVTGLFSYYFGKKWNTEQIVQDEETGQFVRTKNGHTLFWIPIQYVGMLALFLAAYTLMAHSVTQAAAAALLFGGYIFYDYKNTQPHPSLGQNFNTYTPPPANQVNDLTSLGLDNNVSTNETGGGQSTNSQTKDVNDMTDEEREEYHRRYRP